MKEVKPTGIIGIPALWDVLEKRIKAQVDDRGELAKILFKASTALNRQARQFGINFGPILFNEVHQKALDISPFLASWVRLPIQFVLLGFAYCHSKEQ